MVSNRILRRDDASCGRLATVLRSVLAMHGGLWFGWSGKIATTPILDTRPDPRAGFDCAAFDFDRADHEAFYNGFHARALHPLLHSRLHDMRFDREEMAAWLRINAQLAGLLKTQLRPNDRIWINGLHLLPMAGELRAMGVTHRIGLLLHDAVPASSVLASLPRHDEAFRGLGACDLVGVQTAHDLHALRDYLIAFHGAMLDGADGLRVGDRTVRLATFPFGIDVEHMARVAQRAGERDMYRCFRDKLGSHKLLIGVDRPNPANGVCQRLHAIDHLLQQAPQTAGTFSMLQISPPARYDMPRCVKLDDEISRHISDVNGRHGGADWTPVRYIKRELRESALAGYLRMADVGLMTPLRDGMTLAAKEYVACQDPADPGVLVLSRFAGAADELTDAVKVNPLDVGDVAAGIRTAMRMPLDERRARWGALMSVLRGRDLARWSDDFMRALTTRTGAHDTAMPASRTA
ncbi:MAG TPA: trehalose-6-phosphate synthase [Oleiagrimonas sp.]|nr:trehalose-6-phosphate synthase [Oleiagrimonas sp.]